MNLYDVSVKNSSGVEINKATNLVAGEHTVTISRKDRAFADISYNFTVIADRFTVTTDLTETKEIHTDRQKQYLSFNGDYSTLGKNDMPDGKSHLSDSLPVNLAWNFTPASGKTVSKYSVTFGQKSDLSDGYEVANKIEYIDYAEDILYHPVNFSSSSRAGYETFIGGAIGYRSGVGKPIADRSGSSVVGYHIDLQASVGDTKAIFSTNKKTSKGIAYPIFANGKVDTGLKNSKTIPIDSS